MLLATVFHLHPCIAYPSTWRSPNSDAVSQKAAMSLLLDYCNHLHRLIARLGITWRTIACLEVIIQNLQCPCKSQTKLRKGFAVTKVTCQYVWWVCEGPDLDNSKVRFQYWTIRSTWGSITNIDFPLLIKYWEERVECSGGMICLIHKA